MTPWRRMLKQLVYYPHWPSLGGTYPDVRLH